MAMTDTTAELNVLREILASLVALEAKKTGDLDGVLTEILSPIRGRLHALQQSAKTMHVVNQMETDEDVKVMTGRLKSFSEVARQSYLSLTAKRVP